MTVNRRFLSGFLALGMLSLGQVSVLAQPTVGSLTMVFPTRSDAKDLQKQADALVALVSKDLGIPVKAVVSDETAAVEALRANRAEVAFLSSRAALKAEKLAQANLYLAEIRPTYSGGFTYRSVWVVRQDSPLQPKSGTLLTLAQLRGKTIAFASRTSTSGFIFPVGELVRQGLVQGPDRLEGFFGNVFYGSGYTTALQSVLRGQSDIATVSEYALKPPYITEEEGKQLRILHAVPGVPAHGIAITDRVPTALREKLLKSLLSFNQGERNQIFQSLYNATQLVSIDHTTHLKPAKEALLRARIDL
jgi:phosphonate transport system substrate-binding protein